MLARWLVNFALPILILPLAANAAVSCNVATSGVSFGNYDQVSTANTTSMGNVGITCSDLGGAGSLSVSISVSISASATSGTVANRQMAMAGGTDRLNYNLYQDAALSLLWGNTPGVNDVTLPKLRVPKNGSASTSVTIYGSIPAGQNVSVGNYSDSNVLTIFY